MYRKTDSVSESAKALLPYAPQRTTNARRIVSASPLRSVSLGILVALSAHQLGCSAADETPSIEQSSALTGSLHGTFEARKGEADTCPWAPAGTTPLPDASGNLTRDDDDGPGNGFATARIEKTLTFTVPLGARIKNLRLKNAQFDYDDVVLVMYGNQVIAVSDNRLARYAAGGGPVAVPGATNRDVIAPILAGVPDLNDVKPFPAVESVGTPTYDWSRVLGQSVRNQEKKPAWCASPNESCAFPETETVGALDVVFKQFETIDKLA